MNTIHFSQLRDRAIRGHKNIIPGHRFLECHVLTSGEGEWDLEDETPHDSYCYEVEIKRVRKLTPNQADHFMTFAGAYTNYDWRYLRVEKETVWGPREDWRYLADAGVIPYSHEVFTGHPHYNTTNFLLDLTALAEEGIEVDQTMQKRQVHYAKVENVPLDESRLELVSYVVNAPPMKQGISGYAID